MIFNISTYLTYPFKIICIGSNASYSCETLITVTFKGVSVIIASDAFDSCVMTTFNVPWSEGEVANAPWGAVNAEINYNYMEA